MSASLSRYLKDFSAPAAPPPQFADFAVEEGPAEPAVPEVPVVHIDLEAERREAYRQGQEAVRAELVAEHEAALAAATAKHGEEIAALRQQYEVEAAGRIADSLHQIARLLAGAISAEAAAVLAPVCEEAVREKAIAELAVLIEAAVTEGEAGQIIVTGPRHMFEDLSARLPTADGLLRHVEAVDTDLTVSIGESVLVTRMSAWADGLRKVSA